MKRITEEDFHRALSVTTNNQDRRGDFNGVIEEEEHLEFWFQVDTKEFEYVSKCMGADWRTYYTGSE
tara:strand:- start:640 stop:840 length:201 start_codon:yes stop_codon:yes gene_type:complete